MYIKKKGGKIVGAYARPQYQGHLKVPDNDPDLLAFLDAQENPAPPSVNQRRTNIDITVNDSDIFRTLIEVVADLTGTTKGQVIAAMKAKVI